LVLGRAVVLGIIPLAAMLHRLTIGDLCLVAVASSTRTLLFDVSYQAYLPSLIERCSPLVVLCNKTCRRHEALVLR
jgi:hypothetical protein